VRQPETLAPERIPWKRFRPWFKRNFAAGQHVFVVGRTGSGKSYLLRELIGTKPDWDWVVLDAKGGKDPSLSLPGFQTITEWPPAAESPVAAMLSLPEQMRRWFDRWVHGDGDEPATEREPIHVHFAPPKTESDDDLRAAFDKVLRNLYTRGAEDGYSIVFDEGNTIAGMRNDGGLGLYHRVSPLFRVKRFESSSLVIATQYPSWVPRSVYGETSHQFYFHVNDEDRRKRIAEIAGDKQVAGVVAGLRKHDFLYHNVDRDLYYVSKVDA
jgi:energy-coupling factor transporter ATP-binding protein EcfA2